MSAPEGPNPFLPPALQEAAVSGPTDRLVDLLDRLLDRGVMVRGDIWLSVAGVDLVFLGAKLVLASPDRMEALRHPGPAPDATSEPAPADLPA